MEATQPRVRGVRRYSQLKETKRMKIIRKEHYVAATLTLFVVLGFVSVLVLRANAQATPGTHEAEMQTTSDNLIAIDVLIEPDQTMLEKSNAINARLRENYSTGYA